MYQSHFLVRYFIQDATKANSGVVSGLNSAARPVREGEELSVSRGPCERRQRTGVLLSERTSAVCLHSVITTADPVLHPHY